MRADSKFGVTCNRIREPIWFVELGNPHIHTSKADVTQNAVEPSLCKI